LMAQADTQDRLLACVGFDDIEQQTSLRRNARSWREDDLTVGLDLVEAKLVIAQHGDFRT
jgi:hypothetical protein